MSKIRSEHIFTSESVSEGHPDKVCDRVSDAVLDACLAQDSESRVACETLATTDFMVISGEITTRAEVDFQKIARAAVRDIGYTDPKLGFAADTMELIVKVHKQSPDIALGVNVGEGLFREQGAGDQGMMFGFATNETPELMPAPIIYAHRIVEAFAKLRKSDAECAKFLRPDAKSQVSVHYCNGKPIGIDNVVVSHQHAEIMPRAWLEEKVHAIVKQVIPENLLSDQIRYFINPTGNFVIGGPAGDTGLTGRKIIVDTYGGVGSHGGGAFSGKDPSKVDRSAAYMCRYVAKNVVASGLADKCEVQVAYAIGVADPVSVNIDTYGTGKISEAKLQKLVREIFPLKPAELVAYLGLKNPNGWNYSQTTAYGHFGRPQFPWEKTDKAAELANAAK